MSFKIISAEERLSRPRRIKAAIFGPSGVGKTSLLRNLTIPALFVDLEGGDLSIADCHVDSIKVRRWEEARDLACLIGGANLAAGPTEPYSTAHFEHVQSQLGKREDVLGKYELVFLDSITVLSRLCMAWAEVQPENIAKNGAKDTRGAYGLMGREMMRLLTHVQHCPDKHVIFVGILDAKTDDFNRPIWEPQMEGAKIGRELPGVVDEVLSMVTMEDPEQPGTKHRVFVTNQGNQWGYPAKDRSGRLDAIERADLQYVIDKINAQQGGTL
jgi:hypothetical protein